MPTANEDRINLGCLVGDLTARIVTKCGIVYQGAILDWDCGGFRFDSCSPDSEDSKKEDSTNSRMGRECCRSFIRMELDCTPGNICCSVFNADIPVDPLPPLTLPIAASRVTPILGFSALDNIPLYRLGTTILINWDDVASIGVLSNTECLTPDFPPAP